MLVVFCHLKLPLFTSTLKTFLLFAGLPCWSCRSCCADWYRRTNSPMTAQRLGLFSRQVIKKSLLNNDTSTPRSDGPKLNREKSIKRRMPPLPLIATSGCEQRVVANCNEWLQTTSCCLMQQVVANCNEWLLTWLGAGFFESQYMY